MRHLSRALRLIAVVTPVAACTGDLAIPSGFEVACERDADCPLDSTCHPLTRRCEFAAGNSAPVVAFTSVGPLAGRPLEIVDFTLDVRDVNAPPVGTDTVSLTVHYSSDGAIWCPATVVGQVPAIGAQSTPVALGWDALADAQRLAAGDPCALPLAQLVTAPEDDAPARAALAFLDGLRLRVTAADSASPSAHTETASLPFAVGNDAPLLTLIDDQATLRQAAPLEYTLVDSSSDESSLQVQFRIEGAAPSPWYAAELRGSITGVIADEAGSPAVRLVVWSSDAAVPQGTSSGGVGRDNVAITLRARAVEDALDGPLTYGPWSTRTADVRNQSAPVVGAVEVLPFEPGDVATSLVLVQYEVVDAESDRVDVRVDYSVTGEAPWLPASAYPSILHSGRYDLQASDGRPARYGFVWNVGGDLPRRTDQVFLRVTAADDGGLSEPALVAAPFSVGVDLDLDWYFPSATQGTFSAAGTNTLVELADVNRDGRRDVVAWAGGPLQYFPVNAGGALGTLQTDSVPTYRTRALAVGDFNEDGFADVVARDQQDPAVVGFGAAGGLTFGAVTLSADFTGRAALAVGDFDDDDNLDVAANGFQNLVVHRGNGAGAFTASPVVSLGGDIYAMTAGDFDGDGASDIAYAVATSSGVGNVIKVVPVEVRVRFGVSGQNPPLASTDEVVAIGIGINEDGFRLSHVALAAGDLFGDGADELMMLDLQQTNVGRLRVYERAPTWRLAGTTLDLPPLERVRLRTGGAVVVSGAGYARAYVWDALRAELVSFLPVVPGGASDLALADLDGDGDLDLVTAHNDVAGVRLQVDPKGLPAGNTPAFTTLVPDGNVASVASDADRDGLADVAVMDGKRGSSHVIAPFRATSLRDVPTSELEADISPIFSVPENVAIDEATDHACFGDFDGDGVLDAVMSTYPTSHFVAFGESGGFSFSRGVLVTTGQGGGTVLAADFDGDGRDDVAQWEATPGVSLSRGAAGELTSWQSSALTGTIDGLAVGDVDGDALEDLISLDATTREVSVRFANRGAPLSAPCSRALPVGQVPTSAAAGDIDGDGRPELVVASTSRVSAFRFTRCASTPLAFTTIPPPAYATLGLVDVDGDGVLDVVGGVPLSRSVSVLGGRESGGRADGTFAGPYVVAAQGGASRGSWSWGDVNRDGLPDLFYGADDTLRLYVSRRWSANAAWTARLLPAQLVGAEVPTIDRFGEPWTFDVVLRRTTDAPSTQLAAHDGRADFTARLRRSAVGEDLAAAATALTAAWRIEGDLSTSVVIDGGERRTELHAPLARWGVTAAVVPLPIYEAAQGPRDAATVRVFARLTTGYMLEDPAATNPRLARLSDGRTRFEPLESWVELTVDEDGDATTGSGPRFFLDAAGTQVHVVAPSFGVFRAYAGG